MKKENRSQKEEIKSLKKENEFVKRENEFLRSDRKVLKEIFALRNRLAALENGLAPAETAATEVSQADDVLAKLLSSACVRHCRHQNHCTTSTQYQIDDNQLPLSHRALKLEALTIKSPGHQEQ